MDLARDVIPHFDFDHCLHLHKNKKNIKKYSWPYITIYLYLIADYMHKILCFYHYFEQSYAKLLYYTVI